MSDEPSNRSGTEQRVAAGVLRRATISLVGFFLILAAVMFLPAGDVRWARGWLFFSAFLALTVLASVYLWRINPEIFAARTKIQRGIKKWDKVLMSFLFLSLLAVFPVAALDDGRFHWSSVPTWLVVLGYVLFSFGFAMSAWAEAVNRFAELGVRIQTDRGHKVVDTGPYAIVRHPMYLAAFFVTFGVAPALGSFWALIPGAVASLVLVVRTALEDRTLRNELEGYQEYASRVRYRLVPGVW
jgi:protein-S-isoprenylcysteine O-methyltransferase Ste14